MSQAQIKTVSEFNSSNGHLLQENKKASEGKLSGGQPSPTNQLRYPCRFCGRKHESKREACPAWGKQCVKCGKENHFARKCPLSSTSNKVALLEEESELPVLQVFKVSANQSPDSSLVTWRKYPGVRNGETSSLERVFHLFVVVSSRRKQALSSYFGQVSLRRDGCR